MSEFSGRSYGKGYANVSIDTSEVSKGLEGFSEKARLAMRQYFEFQVAPDMREYAENNHGWQNRTRTAEVGLTVDVVTKGSLRGKDYTVGVEIYHTAKHNGYEYGRYLEGIDAGKNGVKRTDLGVLDKTLNAFKDRVVSGMRGVIERYS